MKNTFKKGLVVLVASLLATSVFATDEHAVAAAAAKPAMKAKAAHCVEACHGAKSKKVCKKHCKKMLHHKHMMKKAEAKKAE